VAETSADTEIAYYTLPVILSFEGVEKKISTTLGKVFGDFGQKSSKALADSAEADIKRAAAAYDKLRDKAQDALGKVRVDEEKLTKARAGGKADQIAAAEERLAKSRRDAARVNREAIASYDQISAAQQRLADSTNGLFSKLKGAGGAAVGSGMEAASGFVDGFGGPIAALGSKAGPVGLALAATAGLGLLAGKVLADQVLAGMDQLQDQANIAAKLGLSPDQMKPIAQAAAEAYVGNFGESVAGNMDAARAAMQGGLLDPDATAAETQKIVEQLSTVAAVTGEDIPAAVRTAQQAVRTGLADSYTEAFDLIIRAQQKGLNVSDDLFDTINEYGTQFRKLGLDGAEAFGLIAQAVKGGARDTDTAADALKEFSIRAIDGSKTTGDAFHSLNLSWKDTAQAFAAGGDTAKVMFQEVVDRIAAIDDPVKRAQVQVALFGTKAEDLGDAVNAMNLSTAVDEFGQVQGAAQDAADTMGGTAASAVESAKRSIEVSADGIQQSLAEIAGPALTDLANWLVAHRQEVTDFFVSMGQAAITAGQVVLRSVGEMVQGLGEVLIPIGDVVGSIRKADAWLAEISGDTEKAAMYREQSEAAYGWGESLRNAGQKMAEFAGEGDKLKDQLGKLGEQSKLSAGATETFGDAVRTVGDDAATTIGKVTDLHDAMSAPLIGGGFAAQFNDSLAAAGSSLLGGAAGALPGLPSLSGGPLLGGAAGASSKGSEDRLTKNSISAKRAVEARVPGDPIHRGMAAAGWLQRALLRAGAGHHDPELVQPGREGLRGSGCPVPVDQRLRAGCRLCAVAAAAVERRRHQQRNGRPRQPHAEPHGSRTRPHREHPESAWGAEPQAPCARWRPEPHDAVDAVTACCDHARHAPTSDASRARHVRALHRCARRDTDQRLWTRLRTRYRHSRGERVRRARLLPRRPEGGARGAAARRGRTIRHLRSRGGR
jgi:phage-related minor tail protein